MKAATNLKQSSRQLQCFPGDTESCDRNLIGIPDVSALCRRIARTFCTARRETLSAHSVRNHFGFPSPEVLREWLNEIRVDERYLANFIRQQRL
ncbi:MAG TPA: hypothetical protein PKG48_00985 [Bacteroidales bacterium]|nr:hypothetical protein [Bacteroidales bacterium]HPS61520.1 hypothetical protein [Bacteroidales bacterium]